MTSLAGLPPAAPEFAPLKARLARVYLDHKDDIGAPHATDEANVDRTDEINALMLGAMARAIAERRHTWLLRYGSFVDLINVLLDSLPGKPLGG